MWAVGGFKSPVWRETTKVLKGKSQAVVVAEVNSTIAIIITRHMVAQGTHFSYFWSGLLKGQLHGQAEIFKGLKMNFRTKMLKKTIPR